MSGRRAEDCQKDLSTRTRLVIVCRPREPRPIASGPVPARSVRSPTPFAHAVLYLRKTKVGEVRGSERGRGEFDRGPETFHGLLSSVTNVGESEPRSSSSVLGPFPETALTCL